MQGFTIKPNTFKEVRKAILIRLVPMFAAILVILIVLNAGNPNDPGQVDTWLIMVFLMAAIFSYSIYTNLKRQKRMFESYRLTITDEHIICEQFNTPEIRMPRNSVKENILIFSLCVSPR